MKTKQLYLPKQHHSLADWDISDALWTIVTAQYVTPPSSIEWATPPGVVPVQLCRHADTLKLPEGALSTYMKTTIVAHSVYFLFRNTAPVGQALMDNCYWAYIQPVSTAWTLYERQAGVNIRNWAGTKTEKAAWQWNRYRVSWWNTNWGFTVMLELLVNDHWEQQGDPIIVSNPLFGDEDIQRVGLAISTQGLGYKIWIDDTQIWEKT